MKEENKVKDDYLKYLWSDHDEQWPNSTALQKWSDKILRIDLIMSCEADSETISNPTCRSPEQFLHKNQIFSFTSRSEKQNDQK